MIEELCDLFEQKNYKKMMTNADGIHMYYIEAIENTGVIFILDCDKNKDMNAEALSHIKNRAIWKFITMGCKNIDFLCLYAGRNIDSMRELCTDDDVNWIIDNTFNRLIIYETQKSDFMDLRQDIEKTVERAGLLKNTKRMEYFSTCNIILVLVNIIIFIICEWLYYKKSSMFLYEEGALISGLVMDGEVYRLMTSLFLHMDAGHLFNNMLILFHLGNYLEKQLGKVKYIVLYFLSGIIAGLTSMGYNILTERNVASIGSSGAVFGVAGALAYIILINKGKVENISKRQIVIFLVLSLYGGLSSQNVDNAAHIGGLAAGFILAAVLYRRASNKEKRSGV